MFEVRVTADFAAAHFLRDYNGKCENLHGHNYKVYAHVKGPELNEGGMLMDFSDLKRMVNGHIVDVYDHALVLHRETDAALVEQLRSHYEKIILMDSQPTSEHLLLHFVEILKDRLPSNVRLNSLRLAETATSYAEWYDEDNSLRV